MAYGNPPMMYGAQPQFFGQYQQQVNPYAMQMPAQIQPQPQIQTVQQTPIVARVVKNRKEAEEAQIGFDQTINVMVNVQGDEVYIKRFNTQTGKDDFKLYKSAKWPDVDEGEKTGKTLEAMEQRFKKIEEEIAEIRSANGRRRRSEDDAEHV